ncbi:MAG: hypothetical protein Q9166_006458 [cf. Caloplaca sp. 2 TL-2023]
MPPKKPPLTHFLCLPLVSQTASPQWQASLQHFTNDIRLSFPSNVPIDTATPAPQHNAKESAIPVKAIRPLGTLHLTIGVMSLTKPERVKAVVELMEMSDVVGMLGSAKDESKKIPGATGKQTMEQLRRVPKDLANDIQEEDRSEQRRLAATVAIDSAGQATSSSESAERLGPSGSSREEDAILSTDSGSQKLKPTAAGDGPSPSTDPDQSPSVRPLSLSFTGLKSMKAPKSTSFLYTPPTDTTGRLLPFCQSLKDQFTQADFTTKEEKTLKLHATILNTIYAGKTYPSKKPVQGEDSRFAAAEAGDTGAEDANDGHYSGNESYEDEHANRASQEENEPKPEHTTESKNTPPEKKLRKKGKRKKRVIRFDARDLLARYVDFEWARDIRIEKVSICEMGAKKITDEQGEVVGEEYTEIASVPLP